MKLIIKTIIVINAVLFLSGCSSNKEQINNSIFSVSDSTKIYFAKGNLQYNTENNTYIFANNQYEVLITDGKLPKNQQKGVIDIFEYGSGNNPFKYSENFVDWGKNPILNGGNTPNKWRTLTEDEWLYVVQKRKNFENLIAYGTVNNVKGIILLPDNWILPNNVTFNPLPTNWYKIKNTYLYIKKEHNTELFKSNVYSTEQWNLMENAGAIFLPLNNNAILNGKTYLSGQYWAIGESYANFDTLLIWPKRGCIQKAFCMAVRLVCDIEDY